MKKRKVEDDEYRIRWDDKSKKLIKVSLKDLEYEPTPLIKPPPPIGEIIISGFMSS